MSFFSIFGLYFLKNKKIKKSLRPIGKRERELRPPSRVLRIDTQLGLPSVGSLSTCAADEGPLIPIYIARVDRNAHF